MSAVSRFKTFGAIVATTATAIAAVWLTGDPRAFGVVIALAGLVVGVALGRVERRAFAAERAPAAGSQKSGNADISRAA